MNYSLTKKKAISRRLSPRKKPSKPGSAQTVEIILEGAAYVLEMHGLEGYTTNHIATRAGVSIGSLYQYFPTKDAVTIALIERESTLLVDDVINALLIQDWREGLRAMIEVAVRHQLRRPTLARLLDFEESRLSAVMPASKNADFVQKAIINFLDKNPIRKIQNLELAASDIMSITSALTNAAGRRQKVDSLALCQNIEGALLGYLSVGSKP